MFGWNGKPPRLNADQASASLSRGDYLPRSTLHGIFGARPSGTAGADRTLGAVIKERYPESEWRKPAPASEEALLRAHSRQHLERVRAAAMAFDTDTPAYPGI